MSDAEIMAMSGMADAALQVAGNITASTFNYEHTKQLAKWQNEMNIQNWQMANEYNSPSKQMERLKAAGLNPNLMYGQGTTGNAGAVAATTASSHNEVKNPFEGVQLAGMYQQARTMALDNEMKSLRNAEEYNKLYESELRNNALKVFVHDKSVGKKEPGVFVFSDKYRWRNDVNMYDFDHLRHSPFYQQLEQLWQRGIINEKNIGFIDAKKGLIEAQEGALGFNEVRSKLLKDVLEGDFDMSKLLKLVLIEIMNSTTSPGVISKFF